MKKTLALSLALLLALTLAACAPQPQDNTPSTGGDATPTKQAAPTNDPEQAPSQTVKLINYYLGDGAKDNQEVFDAANALSAEKLGITTTNQYISWSDYNTKYPLVFASGEDFDLIYTSNWSFYAPQAVKGGFYEITQEEMQAYAPELNAQMPQDAWKQTYVNGKIYMIPNVQEEYNHLGLLVRGDLRKKYDIPEITSLDILEQYLDAVAKNEPTMIPMDGGAEFDKWTYMTLWLYQPCGWSGGSQGYAFSLTDPTGTQFKLSQTPEYKEYMARMVDYKNRGFWSKNALNNTVILTDGFKNGKSAAAMHNVGTIVGAMKETNKNHPEWEAEVYDSMFGEYPTLRTSYLGNGMAIHATSANPTACLRWLNYVRTDRQMYDLYACGIEGKHWIDEGEGKMSPTANSADYGGYSNWGFTLESMRRVDINEWEGLERIKQSYSQRAVNNPCCYFLFDDSDVKNEVAAMTNLSNKYDKMLNFGFDANWEGTVADLESQYDAAGREKVRELYETQRAAYLDMYNAE